MKSLHLSNLTSIIIVIIASLFFTQCCPLMNSGEVKSPDNQIKLVFQLQDKVPTYKIYYGCELFIEPSILGLELETPFAEGFKLISEKSNSHKESWTPVYGEYSEIHDNYNEIEVLLEENGDLHRKLGIVFRVYNEGVAFRYLIPEQEDSSEWKIIKEQSVFRFKDGSSAYPIFSTEQTYSNVPVKIEDMNSGAFIPLTVSFSGGFASVLESNVVDYPHSCLDKTVDGKGVVTRIYGDALVNAPFETPWRTIIIGDNEGELIENEFIVLNLNPACKIEDTSWIKAGKTISNEGTVGHDTKALKKIIDFASENGYKYLQLDWGWYGTEVKWDKDKVESFSKIVPERFKNSNWRENVEANPYTVAQGYVPYGWVKEWLHIFTFVDLDIHELIAYGKEKGVGISLYVEAGHTLRSYDLDSLFATYESWGLAGLKPGFVKYGQQENTSWIRNMVETAAKHHLMLCIHDARIPDGMTRTYPNLIINEGGGGQEGNHPVVQDVMLPYGRCLAGPFDYTPMIYTKGRTNAHMISFFVTYYGPAQTIRGGYFPWNDDGRHGYGGDELEFIKRVPASWDETKVLDAKIGDHLIIARRSGKTWFVGGMTGDNPYLGQLPLNFLEKDKKYKVTVFKDDQNGFSDGWCSSVKEVLDEVDSSGTLPFDMLNSGGFVAIIDEME